MHRSPYRRALSLVLSVWLALFLGGSERIVRCSAHGGGAMAMTAHDAASSGTTVVAHDHQADDSSPDGHGAGHTCSCPGPGCCPPAVATVPGLFTPLAHVVAVHEAVAVSALAVFASAQDHLHPPATAPPTVAPAPAVFSVV